MVARAAGFPAVGHTPGAVAATCSFTTQAVGDVVIAGGCFASSGSTGKVSAVSSNRVSWQATPIIDSIASPNGKQLWLWVGTVTSVGADTLTLTFAGTILTSFNEFVVDEISGATNWTVGASGHSYNATSTTVTFPTLTDAGGSLYWGYAVVYGGSFGGSAAGWTFWETPSGDGVVLDTAPPATVTPSGATVSVSAASNTIAVMLSGDPVAGPPGAGVSVMMWNGTQYVQAADGITTSRPSTGVVIWNGPQQPVGARVEDIWNRTVT